jgi:hypothetical protein
MIYLKVLFSDSAASVSRVIGEQYIEEYVEGSGCGLLQVSVLVFSWRD